MVYDDEIRVETRGNGAVQDLTDEVRSVVRRSGIEQGMVNVFNIGSTAAISTIEHEPGLSKDLPATLNKLIPAGRQYGHDDGNAHSHLQATLLDPSLTVPIRDGRPVLGTWQQVVHIECDVRPRTRRVTVTVYGE